MQVTSNEFVDFYFSQYHRIDYLDRIMGLEKYMSPLINIPQNTTMRDILCANRNPQSFAPGLRILNINHNPNKSKLCAKCHKNKQYLRLRYCKKCCKTNIKQSQLFDI